MMKDSQYDIIEDNPNYSAYFNGLAHDPKTYPLFERSIRKYSCLKSNLFGVKLTFLEEKKNEYFKNQKPNGNGRNYVNYMSS